MKTLSICIPSYNRFEKLKKMIENILMAESDDFEVVIVDNCSPRDIYEFLIFDDPRVKIVVRENAVNGANNVNNCILYAETKYAMLVLDKDEIQGQYLDSLIQVLCENPQISGGYCVLNSKNDNYDISPKGAVDKFGYLSKHPSGNIYNIQLLRDYILSKEKQLDRDPFAFDIYLAFCASKGNMLYYDKQLVFSMLDNVKKTDKGSLTFNKSSGNLFYFPQNRINEYIQYSKCMNELSLSKSEAIRALEELYKNTLIQVSIAYKKIMKNKLLCEHYGHKSKRVTFIEMCFYCIKVRKVYMRYIYTDITKKDKRNIEKNIARKVIKKIF